MQPLSQPPASLQHLLQSNAAVPDYIQVKAKGFKAILRSIADFLETYQVQANLLVKLPTGAVWQDDIHRYGQTLAPDRHLLRFVRLPVDAPEPARVAPEIMLPLRDSQNWRGDYFVIIQAENFAAMVVAHRLQPLSAAAEEGEEEDGDAAPLEPADVHPQVIAHETGTTHRSTYLSICVSINPALIATVMAAIHQQVQHLAATHPTAAITDLAQQWDTYCPPVDPSSPTFLTLMDRWLMWQLRLQEQLRQSVTTYRQQAMGLSSLSSQNEVLINTLRLKDEFLNTVGQELRTPLTTIKTALTLLDSPHLKPPQRQRYMEMISQECDRQSALISGVLNLLQIETSVNQTQLTPVMLSETVPPVVSTYQPLAAEKGVMLAYTIPNHLPKVACPDAWLRQMMIHLLNNGIKYTRSGGEVWVTARAAADCVEIEVRDTGVGIPAADLPNIFDYFYRGRNLPADGTEGAGLGLSIVQQLLMFCGGTIVVNSQPDQGTTFLLRIPLHQG